MSEIFKIFWFMLLACKENVNYVELGNRYAVKLKKNYKKNNSMIPSVPLERISNCKIIHLSNTGFDFSSFLIH